MMQDGQSFNGKHISQPRGGKDEPRRETILGPGGSNACDHGRWKSTRRGGKDPCRTELNDAVKGKECSPHRAPNESDRRTKKEKGHA
jgi:hypothetical protein